MGTFIKLFTWYWGLTREKRREITPYVPQYAVPNLAQVTNPDPTKIQITWVGQSTFLIQIAGVNILTDPIWSERASPIPWLGPKRHARPGIALKDLPNIDIVLISHTHYDHLDRPTIRKLGASPRYVLPPNVGRWFERLGIRGTTQLRWWESENFGQLKITAVPADHWSKRNLFGTENAGWGGYILEVSNRTIYFTGDTGYHREYFKEIGKRFPHIDLGLIPVGAYYPREIFGKYHVDPREAVIIHREVGAKESIGMHWGTFKLTQEPLDEPPTLLKHELVQSGLPADEFSTMKIGETRVL